MPTILVIEDHAATRETLCLILKTQGYRCFGAGDSKEAEKHFLNEAVDLVIVDHGLPGITGTELAEQLKKIRVVRVLMLSGNPEISEKPEPVDMLLPKPLDVPKLFAAVKHLIGRNTSAS